MVWVSILPTSKRLENIEKMNLPYGGAVNVDLPIGQRFFVHKMFCELEGNGKVLYTGDVVVNRVFKEGSAPYIEVYLGFMVECGGVSTNIAYVYAGDFFDSIVTGKEEEEIRKKLEEEKIPVYICIGGGPTVGRAERSEQGSGRKESEWERVLKEYLE